MAGPGRASAVAHRSYAVPAVEYISAATSSWPRSRATCPRKARARCTCSSPGVGRGPSPEAPCGGLMVPEPVGDDARGEPARRQGLAAQSGRPKPR